MNNSQSNQLAQPNALVPNVQQQSMGFGSGASQQDHLQGGRRASYSGVGGGVGHVVSGASQLQGLLMQHQNYPAMMVSLVFDVGHFQNLFF